MFRKSKSHDLRSSGHKVQAVQRMHELERVQVFESASSASYDIAWSPDGTLLVASGTGPPKIWLESDASLIKRIGLSKYATGVAWHPHLPALAVGSHDGSVSLLMNPGSGDSRVLCHVGAEVMGVAWSPDGTRLAITDSYGFVSVCGMTPDVLPIRIHAQSSGIRPLWKDDETLFTFGADGVAMHPTEDLTQVDRLPASFGRVWDVDVSRDGKMVAVAAANQAVHVMSEGETRSTTLEGLLSDPRCVSFSHDSQFLAAAADDRVLLWRCRDWVPVARVSPPAREIGRIDFHPSKPLLAVANPARGRIICYRLDYAPLIAAPQQDSQHYVNAKVVLLGDTGVGKSGLGLVLSGQPYRATDSTHGRNVWIFDSREVEMPGTGTQMQEVLLWDLAGQPGYRLVHQLHLNEVATALIVFDSRSETDPFSGVKHWVRALTQARRLEGTATVPTRTYLVAARADRGGVAVTRERIQGMIDDFGLDGFFETSAKEGWQVAELAAAIRDGINWNSLPMVSSSAMFQSIKEFLLDEKEQGRLLSTTTDLFHGFRRTHPNLADQPDLWASFNVCVGRVESRDLITRLHFGDLVLLQPELLDSYASAVIQAAKEEPDGLGFIPKEEALEGRFRLPETERVPDRGQEKLLLIATVEELLRHEIALTETTDRGADLIFPSQFTREQPDAPDIPGKHVVITFEGPLRSVYARLAVRLSHSTLFKRQDMWQNAASYSATDGGTCGIHLRELDEGRGEFALFYDDQAGPVVRAQFETYVHDYLQLRALPGSVTLRRIQVCPECGYTLDDELARRRLDRGATTIRCPDCEQAVISLVDAELPAPADSIPVGTARAVMKPTDAAVAAMNRSADLRRDQDVAAARLQGKIETNDFDVFLCYHSKDRDQVTAIGEKLRERGIHPWLDIWEIPPGTRWQRELHKHIKSVKSAAVFIGPNGSGPWQDLEVESLLSDFAKRHRRVIPVILVGRQGKPRIPGFLNQWHVVDMRTALPDPFEQLVWGITGQKPGF